MTNKPRRTFEKLISSLALLLALPSSGWAQQSVYKEFLNGSDIITVSGEKIDDDHTRINTIQIAHDQFRELRVLNPSTGATDVLEFSDSTLQMTYSLPHHGNFLKLQIKRRENDGIRTADFAWDSSTARYLPLRQRFRKYQVFHKADDFGVIGVCRAPQSSLINNTGINPVIERLRSSSDNIASRCLDSSCQTEPFLSEFPAMSEGVSMVIASRDSQSSNGNGANFLGCLNDHHLSYYAGKLNEYFDDSLKPSSSPTVVCQNKNNGALGDYIEKQNHEAGLTSFDQPWAYSSNSEPEHDAKSFYADTFFHESLHRVGIEDEDLTENIVSCCGLVTPGGNPTACAKVDQDIAKINLRNAQLKASLDNLEGFDKFWLKVQKASDEDRTEALYDDFLEVLASKRGQGGSNLGACLKTAEKSSEECVQNFEREISSDIDSYFQSSCLKRFKDKSEKDRKILCNDLDKDAKEIVHTNLNKVCDASKTNAFERSCIAAVGTQTKALLANSTGRLLDEPELMSSAPENPQDKIVRNALITALDHQIPAIEVAFNNFKSEANDASHPDRAQKILSELIKFVGTTAKDLHSDYETCLADGKDPSKCADVVEHILFNGRNGDSKHGLIHFFRSTCRAYFTKSEAADKPCSTLKRDILKAFTESFSGGCKTTDASKRFGAPGNDITCLMNAITESQFNIAHYAELEKAGKIISADSKPRALAPTQESKDVANNVAKGDGNKPQSIQIGDQNSKPTSKPSSNSSSVFQPAAQYRSNYAANRSPASSRGDVSSRSFGDFDNLKKQLAAEPSPTSKVVQGFFKNANQVMSNLAIPEAEAKTRYKTDTSSLNRPVPAPVAYDQPAPTQAPASTRGTLAGLIEASRASSASAVDSVSSGARKSVAVKGGASDAKYRAQSNNVKADTDGKASSEAGKQKGRLPASSADTTKASASKKGQGTTAAAAGATHGDSNAKDSNASDNLRHLQYSILKHFKDDPQRALARLKSHSLDAELRQYLIQVKDENGQPYGSESPRFPIWYDKDAKVFKGLPDDL